MAFNKLSVIVILALACHAIAVEVSCMNRNRQWCIIADEVSTTVSDPITITKAEPKETVIGLRWAWATNIKSMPTVWFEMFPNLETLDITGMGIEDMIPNTFQMAHMLKTLIMKNNNVRMLPNSILHKATNLTLLDMDNNKIVQIQDGAMTGLNKLKSLTMDNNKMTILRSGALIGAQNMETLSLSGNMIKEIENGALNLPRLKTLYLDENLLRTLPNEMLSGCPLLTHIDLSNNLLTTLPLALTRQSRMHIMILDSNPLEKMHLRELLKIPSLETISVKDTGIKTTMTEADWTTSIPTELNRLDLSGNGIRDPTVLKQLRMLTKLDTIILDENKMERIDLENIKTMLPSLSTIEMEDVEVDCEWLAIWLPKMAQIDVDITTGELDADVPMSEQRASVDRQHVCGKLLN